MSGEQSTESMAAGLMAIPFALALPVAQAYAAWLIYGWHLVPLGAPVVSFKVVMVLHIGALMVRSRQPTAADRFAAVVAPKATNWELVRDTAALYAMVGVATWFAWWLS